MNMYSPNVNIVFFIRSLSYGGAERQLLTLTEYLAKEGLNITILYFYAGELAKEITNPNINLVCLNKAGRWDFFGVLWRVINELRKIKPDVCYSYSPVTNILSLFFKPFLPSTKLIWGVRCSNLDWSRYDWFSAFIYKCECRFSKIADLIIVNSHAGRQDHVNNGFPNQKTIVIPNGINAEKFKPDLAARKKLRAEWKIQESEILIGLIGRLDPMKDSPTFLKAAALLSEVRQDVFFVCVGSGSECYTQELYRLVQKLGIAKKVIWAGYRTDMPNIYNALDILCSSSSYGEGFPNVIGEAMACGIPCVVTDVGDSAWIVGNTGVVVPPQNPEALVAGWEELLGANRLEKGLKARTRIIENFGINQLVEKTKMHLSNIKT